jgi:hypothetical protein
MAAVKDIQLSEGDLLFFNGDFKIDFSDEQHIEDIISENIGAYKQFPLCGVGIIKYLSSSGTQQILRNEISTQLSTDGYTVNSIDFSGNDTAKFTVDAVRN